MDYRSIKDFQPSYIVVESFHPHGEASRNSVRVRPIPSEGFSPDVRVQCSRKMRYSHSVGTKFRIFAFPRIISGHAPMLTTRNSNSYEVIVTDQEPSKSAYRDMRSSFDKSTAIRRAERLISQGQSYFHIPQGKLRPPKSHQTLAVYLRSPSVIAWIKWNAEGACELCRLPSPFQDDLGNPYLEVHHVVALADGGSDTIENAVGVCPNCHKALHYASDRERLKKELYVNVDRLARLSN